MKKRFITGVGYVIVMLGLLALKIYVPAITVRNDNVLTLGDIGVDLLFWAISIIGAFEFLRAVKEVSPNQWWVTMITCTLITPAFVLTKMFFRGFGSGHSSEAALIMLLSVASVGMMFVASLMVFDFEKSSLKSTALAELCILYCGILTCVGPNINHIGQDPSISRTAILFLFFLTPGVDAFAFFFGKLLGKKLPYKIAPHTSPNKTVIGSIGGIVGGIFAATLAWLVTEYLPGASFNYSGSIPKIALLIIFALPASIFAQIGDLFESAVKRGCGVKDMGKLLLGHGGILDRFDSMLFASVAVVVCFMIIA